MASANTISAVYNNPAVTINSTTETVILNKAGQPVVVGLEKNANFDGGRQFIVHLRGTAKGGALSTLLLKLYLGTSPVVGSNVAVAAFTVSAAIPVTGGQFDVEACLNWDSASATMHGYVAGHTNGVITPVASTSAITSGVATPDLLQFVATATFGAALATNKVTLTEFSIEQN